MATFYLKSGSGVTQFAQSTAYSVGDRIVPVISDAGSNFAVARRWVWECTTGGTTAGANPTWPASVTQDVTTVTSNTAVFTARKPGFSSGTTADWTFAAIFLQYLNGAITTGDTIYVSDGHSESFGEAISISTMIGNVLCVDDAATPPTALATTAVIATSGEFAITTNSLPRTYFYGITFRCGVGATGTRSITLGGTYDNCVLELATTGASSTINGNSSAYWIDTQVKFAAAGQTINILPSRGWIGGGLASGGTSPTALLSNASAYGYLENLDLSAGSAGMNFINSSSIGHFEARNIKMPASWSGAYNANTAPSIAYSARFYNVGAGSTTNFYEKFTAGEVFSETTLVKTGGSATSFKMASDADAFGYGSPIVTPEISRYNATTGSAITVTVDILRDSATNLTDQDIALEVSYRSASDSPLGASVSSASALVATASDLAASSATWTTTGMSNPNEQKLTVTFTPQVAGFIHATVKLFKASATVYVDPVLQIS